MAYQVLLLQIKHRIRITAESAISWRCPISSVLIVRNTFSPVLFNVHAGTDFAQIASKASKLGNKLKQSNLKPAISLTHPPPPQSWLYTYIIIIIHAHHKHNHGIMHPLANINSTVTLLKLIPSIACNAYNMVLLCMRFSPLIILLQQEIHHQLSKVWRRDIT